MRAFLKAIHNQAGFELDLDEPVNSQLKYNYSYPAVVNYGSREYCVFLKAIHNN